MTEIVIAIGTGIVLGIYIASQIMSNIECNINQKNLIKNMEKYDEKTRGKGGSAWDVLLKSTQLANVHGDSVELLTHLAERQDKAKTTTKRFGIDVLRNLQ